MRIGLLLVGNSSWVGGIYYVLNIVRGISQKHYLSNTTIVVFYSREVPEEIITELKQNKIVSLVKLFDNSVFEKGINWICRYFFHWNWWLSRLIDNQNVDVIYPLMSWDGKLKTKAKQLFWIYDFQHIYLPDYFSKEEYDQRESTFSEIAKKASDIVVSSFVAKAHFEKQYPSSKAKLHVFQFPSIINVGELTAKTEILSKYSISKPYFLVCNQFWKHKNHALVLDALVSINEEPLDRFEVVFTGKMEDYRNPDYVNVIKQKLKHPKLKIIKNLGFIDRIDQLSLMKHCMAVIQPSLFEGWGTVIEDAKTLGVSVLASDIPIHREQLGNHIRLFNPEDPNALRMFIESSTTLTKSEFHYLENENSNFLSIAQNALH